MTNTIRNSKGRTLYRVVLDGIDYGFMTAKARRELLERNGR